MMRMRMMMEVDDPLNISEHQLQEHLKQVKEEKEKDDHHRSLFTLLHDITLRFENDRRYWNDARYIRIWLQYASFFHDPSWVYQHMLQKQIGEYVGAFYQNAADYYEHQHRWKEAENFIQLGIEKKAEPLSRLHDTLHQIQQKQIESSKLLTTFKDRPFSSIFNPSYQKYPPSQLISTATTTTTSNNCFKNNEQKSHYPPMTTITTNIQDEDKENKDIYHEDQLKHQQMRMATVQTCYQGQEILSFEELRAQLLLVEQEDRRNKNHRSKTIPLFKPNQIQNQRQTTSFHHGHGTGARSEEARQIIPPTQPSVQRALVVVASHRTDHPQQQQQQQQFEKKASHSTNHTETPQHVVSIPHGIPFIRHTLAHCRPSWTTWPECHDFSTLHSKRIQVGQLLSFHDSISFRITLKIGQGGIARVYHAIKIENKQPMAIKVEKPANPWEFYILHQLHTRLATPTTTNTSERHQVNHQQQQRYVIQIHDFYLYYDTSYLIMDYGHQGTLLDCFNTYRDQQGRLAMPEPLAMFLMVRLLQAIHTIHQVGIVHGDLKMDNVLMALSNNHDESLLDTPWQRYVYLVLIDFGRAVDLTVLPNQVMLKADWSPQTTDPWMIHQGHAFLPRFIDYYGVASIVHWLLFGKPMQVVVVGKGNEKRQQIQERWKRYWHVELWQPLFEFLLNPPPVSDQQYQQQEVSTVAKVIHMGYQILQREGHLATHLSQLVYALR